MNRRKTFDGFQLDGDATFNQQIDSANIVEMHAIVIKRNRYLSSGAQTAPLKIAQQNGLIHRLQEARPKRTMKPISGIHDLTSDVIERSVGHIPSAAPRLRVQP